jgi:hypothetical protein
VATANTRATDSNRVDTCQLLDSALSDGQLSMEEHRVRVSAATKATTLGELQSLVSDLQFRRPPAQFPDLKSLAGDRRVRIAALLAVVLLGVGIAWGFLRNTDGGAKPAVVSPVVAAPETPTPAPTLAPPQTSAPPIAPEQLMTVGGLSGLIAQIRTKFGDTIGYELEVDPERATIRRPDSVNAHKTAEFTYTNGLWSSLSWTSKPFDTVVGDIGKFDVQAVISALRAAPQTLHIDGGHPQNISIQSAEDGTLRIELYVTNGYTQRYLMVNADGSIRPDY